MRRIGGLRTRVKKFASSELLGLPSSSQLIASVLQFAGFLGNRGQPARVDHVTMRGVAFKGLLFPCEAGHAAL